jgi:hypothetical protein
MMLLVLLLVSCKTEASMVQTTAPEATSEIRPQESTEYQNLDLREANVLAVRFQPQGDGEFRFEVTLIHDDSGEAPDFANWWQVEDIQGNLLGRRELTHSHGTEAFTRSQLISIPDSIDTVVVRGHDMRHGYGGQSMRVDMRTGETTPFDEDSDANPP